MMDGYDLKLVRNIVKAENIPVTVCDGNGGIDDKKAVIHEGHAHAAVGGSMFVYYGNLKAVLITAPTAEEYYLYNIFNG